LVLNKDVRGLDRHSCFAGSQIVHTHVRTLHEGKAIDSSNDSSDWYHIEFYRITCDLAKWSVVLQKWFLWWITWKLTLDI
jgi:hypothetical protein